MQILKNIGVGIKGGMDVTVSQPVLEYYGLHSGLDAACREGVPQAVLTVDRYVEPHAYPSEIRIDQV